MEKLCPMNFSGIRDHAGSTCIKEKCAWWIVYMKGTDKEWSQCAVCALSHLHDMATGDY